MSTDHISPETRVTDAMNASGMAWWEMELPSGVVFFHPNKAHMLGYKPEKFIHYTHFTELIHPEDYAQAMDAMMQHIEGKKELYETKYRIRAADGSYRKFYDKGRIVQKLGEDTRIAGMVIDLDSISKL